MVFTKEQLLARLQVQFITFRLLFILLQLLQFEQCFIPILDLWRVYDASVVDTGTDYCCYECLVCEYEGILAQK